MLGRRFARHHAGSGHGAREQIADEGQAGALVFTKGQGGADRLLVHHAGIGRGAAFGIDQGPGDDLSLVVVGNANLAQGDHRCGEVEDGGRRGRGAGNGDADRVGGVATVLAAERGDAGLAAIAIDEGDRDKPSGRSHLTIGADAADVVDVPEAVNRDALGLGGVDAPLHGLASDDLAVTVLAIPDGEGAVLADDGGLMVRLEVAGFQRLHVGREHHDAMAVMAREVGADQVIGHRVRLVLAAAAGAQKLQGDIVQLGVRNHHGRSLPWLNCQRSGGPHSPAGVTLDHQSGHRARGTRRR